MKKVWLAGAVVVAFAGCQADPPAPGASSLPIVNGTREPQVVALTDPQILAIGWLYAPGDPSFPFCTGTLIAPNLVVTAAHCVWGSAAGEIGFGVGVDPSAPDGLFLSTGVFANREVDAALILLGEDVTASGLDITPIPVNQAPLDDTLVDRPVQAGGYGDTLDPDRDGRWFATVYVSDVTATEVVVDGRGEQGICFGDSGSGLIDLDEGGNPVVLAVESNGDVSCVDIDHLTRLDPIWDWIGPVIDGELPPDPCEGVGDEGRCDGDVAVSCRRGTLREIDCSTWGVPCGYVETAARYACACGPVPDAGWCDGDVAEYCRDGRVSQTNCATRGQGCGWVDADARYGCDDAPTCLPEDEAGRCEGDTAIHCASDRTTRELCSLAGQACVETADGASCVGTGPGQDAGVDAGPDGDAGAPVDAGADAGGGADAAADGDGGPSGGGGCACRAPAPSRGKGALSFLLACPPALLLRRGRRITRGR